MSADLSTSEIYRYTAFCSYSHQDRAWARWLMRRIERYRVPRHLVGTEGAHGPIPATLSPVFRDREELPSGADLSAHIQAALADSAAMILIASPAAAKSRWVNEEVRKFRELGRGDRLFAFIVDGEPGGEDDDCFPPALIYEMDDNGEPVGEPAEPVAADARPQGDGKKRALGKLAAGLLGVSYGELERREIQRRNRRLVGITSASIAGLVLTAGLAVSAYLAREDAERRRGQAEGLLGFMVGDLRDSLEPLGRLDLLAKVSDEAMDYFSSVQPGDLTDEGLARQAQTLTSIGEVRLAQARYDEADASFREAYNRSTELVRRNPGNGDRLFDRGQAEFWVGYVAFERQDFEYTRPWFEAYLATSAELAALDPDKIDWQIELAYAQHNLAVLEKEAGNIEAAMREFDAQVETWESLDCDSPDCDDIKFDLADSYTWQGLVALQLGQISNYRDAIGRARGTYGKLMESQPANRIIEAEYADETRDLGRAAHWLGDAVRARELFDEARQLRRALHEHDPLNQDWMDYLAATLADLGELFLNTGDIDDGLAFMREVSALDDGSALVLGKTLNGLESRVQALLARALFEAPSLLAGQQLLREARDLVVRSEATDSVTAATIEVSAAHLLLKFGEIAPAQQQASLALAMLEEHLEGNLHPTITQPWVRLMVEQRFAIERTPEREGRLQQIREGGLATPGLWPDTRLTRQQEASP